MTDPLTLTLQQLKEFGFFKYIIPYIITSAIFYGILKKSKIFGDPKEATTINAAISLAAALMVMASPVLVGIDLEQHLSKFLLFSIIVFVVVLGIMMVFGMIFPQETFNRFVSGELGARKIWHILLIAIFGIGFLIAVFLASGIVDIIFPSGITLGSPSFSAEDIISVIVALIGLAIMFFAIKWLTGGEKGS